MTVVETVLRDALNRGKHPKVRINYNPQYDKEYVFPATLARKKHDDQVGRVVDCVTGHGICFRVRFRILGLFHAETASYEPEEIKLL